MTALTDDFNRADSGTPGGIWTNLYGVAQIVSNQIVYTDPTAAFVSTTLATINHYTKASYAGLADVNANQLFAIVRFVNSASPFYAIWFNTDVNTVEWRSHSSSADLTGTLIQSASLSIGTTGTFGVIVKGTGSNTEAKVWNSPSGLPTSTDDWGGPATLTFTNNPGTACDAGLLVGWGGASGNPFSMSMDNWFGGDVALALVFPAPLPSINWHQQYDWRPENWDFPLDSIFALDDFPISAATPGALSGTASITFGQTGALTGAGALAGSATITFSQTGLLRGTGILAGTSTITFSQTGALGGSGALVGASTIIFGQSGNLLGAGALSGASSITFSQTGDLKGAGALSGSTTITFSQTGDLQNLTAGAISGTASITFSQTGSLAGAGALVGAAAISFTQLGALTGSGALAGTAAVTFNQAGDLKGAGALIGAAAITFNQAADLKAAGALAGTAAITLSQTGNLTNGSPGALEGTAAITFSATGDLTSLTPADAVTSGGGGWNGVGFFYHFEEHRRRRQRELDEIAEREAETERIADELTRQIAEQFRLEELKAAKRAEAARLQRLADMFAGDSTAAAEIPAKVLAAIERAATRRTFAMLQKMQAEILAMYEEEEAAAQAAIMLDDD